MYIYLNREWQFHAKSNELTDAFQAFGLVLLIEHKQGRRNEYESGGARIRAGKFFLSCPPPHFLYSARLSGGAQCNVLSLQPSTVHVDTKFVNCHTVMN